MSGGSCARRWARSSKPGGDGLRTAALTTTGPTWMPTWFCARLTSSAVSSTGSSSARVTGTSNVFSRSRTMAPTMAALRRNGPDCTADATTRGTSRKVRPCPVAGASTIMRSYRRAPESVCICLQMPDFSQGDEFSPARSGFHELHKALTVQNRIE